MQCRPINRNLQTRHRQKQDIVGNTPEVANVKEEEQKWGTGKGRWVAKRRGRDGGYHVFYVPGVVRLVLRSMYDSCGVRTHVMQQQFWMVMWDVELTIGRAGMFLFLV